MLDTLTIRDVTFSPARFLAPMAGITSSAFRRLVADFGGYGALFTEMLPGNRLLAEKLADSPYTKRRSGDGALIYQLLCNGDEDIPKIIDHLKPLFPDGIDLNAACPAPEIVHWGAGSALCSDLPRLQKLLRVLRSSWDGPLSIKVRIGTDPENWKAPFTKLLAIIADEGVDWFIVHPRFAGEKLKRCARFSYVPWIASKASLPFVLSGDIVSLKTISENPDAFAAASGLMIGRMAVVQPWIFQGMNGVPMAINHGEVWRRYFTYVNEDFPADKVLGRIKEFTAYYSRNFFFGHDLFRAVQSAVSLDLAMQRAEIFFSKAPKLSIEPSVAGV